MARTTRSSAPLTRARVALVASALALFACGLQPPEDTVVPESTPPPETPPPVVPVEQGPVPPAGSQLVWADEFEGVAVDRSRWNIISGERRSALMTADAVTVRNGVLTVTTYTEANGEHRTGFLETDGTFYTTYGYFEARIRFNDSPGSWCAFWLDTPTDSRPPNDPARAGAEIDIVEHRVTDQGGWTELTDMIGMNVHWDRETATPKSTPHLAEAPPGVAPLQGQWHTYGVHWTSTGYTFYVDRIPIWTTQIGVSRRSQFIRLTCEVEDLSWAGNVPRGGYGSRTTSVTRMDVDYVRVWQP
jgi:beta-glucanase (GH16 family)